MKVALLISGRLSCEQTRLIPKILQSSWEIHVYLSLNELDDPARLTPISSRVKGLWCSKYTAPQEHPKKAHETVWQNMMSMFYHKFHVFQMLGDEHYDVVVSFRPDFMTDSLPGIFSVEPGTIYAPEGDDYGGLNDRCAYGNLEAMKFYCSAYLHVDEALHSGAHDTYNPERILAWHLRDRRVTRFPYDCSLDPDRNLRLIPAVPSKMKTFIEVGAFDGSDSLQAHSRGFTVYTFEPKRDLYESLVNRTRHLQGYTVIPKAVCLQDGKTQFNICQSGGASSILKFRSDEELNEAWSPQRQDVHYSGESYEVETTRLDTFIEQTGLKETVIDYLHIDAQGVDLDVLKSTGVYIKNVQAGVVETVMNPDKAIYEDQVDNTLDNVRVFLESNGFRIQNIQSNDNTGCEYNVHFSRKL
jgi:FkbM family methyltransferase